MAVSMLQKERPRFKAMSTVEIERLKPPNAELFKEMNSLRECLEEELRRRETEFMMQSPFEKGKAYFERNKETLIRNYEGKYIAIWGNQVLDSDTSFSSLAQRVYEKLGYVSIYMPFVTSKPRVLRFHSPKYKWF